MSFLSVGDTRAEDFRRWMRRSREVLLFVRVTGALTAFAVVLFERVVVNVLLARVLEAPLRVGALAPGLGMAVTALLLRCVGRRASPGTADEYLHAFHDG